MSLLPFCQWLADTPDPDIRSVRPGRAAGGSDWIGLRRNEGYTVSGINQTPLLPGILVALVTLISTLLTAQNIGFGTGPHATPAGIVNAWMHSPPHRRIMLTGAYRDAGVGSMASVPSGISSSWLGGTYAVEFGMRGR